MSSLLDLMSSKSLGIFCFIIALILLFISFNYKEWYRKNLLLSFSFFQINIGLLSIFENETYLIGLHIRFFEYLAIIGFSLFLFSLSYGLYVTFKQRRRL
jgi:hypothetical protein